MNPRGSPSSTLQGIRPGQRRAYLRRIGILQRLGQQRYLGDLLRGKGQPVTQFAIQAILALQIYRTMQQRATGRDPQPVTPTGHSLWQAVQHSIEITTPDIAPVDHSHRQHLVGGQAINDRQQLLRSAHQIHMQTVHRQATGQSEVIFQTAEIGGQKLLQGRVLQAVVDTFIGGLPVRRQVQYQSGLVYLHPLHALGGKTIENLDIHRQQCFKQLKLVELAPLGLAQPQITERAQHHRFDPMAQGDGLIDLLEQLGPLQTEGLATGELGDQIVVIGIKPLGHLAGERLGTVATHTPGHAKQGIQIGRLGCAETLRHRAHHQAVGQHLVVPGEVAHRNQFQSRVPLQLPVCGAQLTPGLQQTFLFDLAGPEGLQRLFQLAVATDTGESQIVCQCHNALHRVHCVAAMVCLHHY